jgi:hypothetical protein
MRAIVDATLLVEAADVISHGLKMRKGADSEAPMERRTPFSFLFAERKLCFGMPPMLRRFMLVAPIP